MADPRALQQLPSLDSSTSESTSELVPFKSYMEVLSTEETDLLTIAMDLVSFLLRRRVVAS